MKQHSIMDSRYVDVNGLENMLIHEGEVLQLPSMRFYVLKMLYYLYKNLIINSLDYMSSNGRSQGILDYLG